ncbi:MAG: hypothetical protein ACI8QH_001442, partial [Flammeovirgaceae bacterium]
MRILTLLLFLGFGGTIFAQNIPFEKANYPNDKDGFKLATKNMKEGDRIFDEDRRAYFNLAIPYYMAAQEFNPDNSELNYKLGV